MTRMPDWFVDASVRLPTDAEVEWLMARSTRRPPSSRRVRAVVARCRDLEPGFGIVGCRMMAEA